jgi:translation initiation factor 2 alpha subunit (eIF-2alpha)
MPSAIDRRRLKDGERAMMQSAAPPQTIDEAVTMRATLLEGLVALQSLDDLGVEENKRVFDDMSELETRLAAVEATIRAFDQKAPKK